MQWGFQRFEEIEDKWQFSRCQPPLRVKIMFGVSVKIRVGVRVDMRVWV
jgi:hypothetical protein